jgi:hypothetical protein
MCTMLVLLYFFFDKLGDSNISKNWRVRQGVDFTNYFGRKLHNIDFLKLGQRSTSKIENIFGRNGVIKSIPVGMSSSDTAPDLRLELTTTLK